MNNLGLKISKNNIDVISGTSQDMYVDTSLPILKVFSYTTGTQNFSSDDRSQYYPIVIVHNLGYVPNVLCYMDRSPNEKRRPVYNIDSELDASVDAPSRIFVTMSIDETQVNIGASGGYGVYPPSAGDYGYACYIFYDPNKDIS